MLTRRQFGTAAAVATASLAAPAIGRAQQLTKVKVALASGVNDAQVAFQTIGMHPRLRWYQDDGLELEIVNTTNTSMPMQLLSNGQVEFATTSAYNYIPAYAENPDLNLLSAYTWMPRVHNQVMVSPDSPYKSISDLKGKTIGIRSTGDSGYFFLQGVFAQLGIDPQKDVEWLSVGAGGPAGQALRNGTVQALAVWDAEFVRIGNIGFALRQLPNPPSTDDLFGNTYLVNRTGFPKNKGVLGKAFRALAKGQVFAAANPRAAVLLHWDLYPESKPKGKSDAEALKDMIELLDVRKDKWFPLPSSPDQRLGAATPHQWQASLRFVEGFAPEIKGRINDAGKLFTNELLDEANRFDRAALETEARAFKV